MMRFPSYLKFTLNSALILSLLGSIPRIAYSTNAEPCSDHLEATTTLLPTRDNLSGIHLSRLAQDISQQLQLNGIQNPDIGIVLNFLNHTNHPKVSENRMKLFKWIKRGVTVTIIGLPQFVINFSNGFAAHMTERLLLLTVSSILTALILGSIDATEKGGTATISLSELLTELKNKGVDTSAAEEEINEWSPTINMQWY